MTPRMVIAILYGHRPTPLLYVVRLFAVLLTKSVPSGTEVTAVTTTATTSTITPPLQCLRDTPIAIVFLRESSFQVRPAHFLWIPGRLREAQPVFPFVSS